MRHAIPLVACLLLWSDAFGPMLNTPLRDLYTEVKVELCSDYVPALVVSSRTYQVVQTASGEAERHYFGAVGRNEWWSEVVRQRLTIQAGGGS